MSDEPAEDRSVRGNKINPHSIGEDATVESVSAKQIDGGPTFAKGYEGATADDRLDAALADAADGDTIVLEPELYNVDRTISKSVTIRGSVSGFETGGSEINADYTLDGRIKMINIQVINTASITINGVVSAIISCDIASGIPVTIAAGEVRYLNNHAGKVTFQSGTAKGIVDGCVKTVVTDNGSNTVGDIT